MPKLIALPDGSTGSFPDDMDDAAITAVLRKQFPPKAEATPDPAEGMSALERGLAGAGGAVSRIRDRIFPPASPIEAMTGQPGYSTVKRRDDLATYERNKDALGTAGAVGEIAGEVAATAVPIARVSQVGGQLLKRALGRMAPAAAHVATNAAYAGGTAAPEERGNAAALGAAGAAGGRLLTRTLGGVARPLVSKDARALIDAGVKPTPGQLFGDGPMGSAVRSLEDKATSIPLVGEVIQHSRRRAISEYGNAEINAALKPLGQMVKGSGAEAVEQAQRLVAKSYDRVLPEVYIPASKARAALASARAAVDNVPLIDDEQKARLGGYILKRVMPVIEEASKRGGNVDGKLAKGIDAELGHHARQYTNSLNPGDHPMGEAFYEIQAALRTSLEGKTPEATKLLTATNTAYRQMLPILKAADRTTSGQFTPRQLNRASGQFNQTPSALNRAGQNVLPSSVPDSGSAGRLLMGATAIGGASLGGPAAGAGVAAALYSGPGLTLLVDGLRGAVPDYFVTYLKQLPPAQQRSMIQQIAGESPNIARRVGELAPQIARTLATQEQP